MRLSKTFYGLTVCALLCGCQSPSAVVDNNNQAKTPYVSVGFPASWNHYDQSSLNMMPDLFTNMVSEDALWIAYDQQSWGSAVMRQQPVFADFNKFKESLLEENKTAHGQELDYQFDASFDRQIGQQKALELVGHYLQQVPVKDKNGQQIGLKSRRINQHFLAIDWPVGGVTTVKCEEAVGAPKQSCNSIFAAINLGQPDLSIFVNKEPVERPDYFVGVPEGWFRVVSDIPKAEMLRLPPQIRATYNPQEDVNIISPDSNYLITLNKVNFDLPLEEVDQINEWGQGIFENASKQSQSKPTYLGVSELKGTYQVTIDDLAFRAGNSQIKTRLSYILSNNFAVGVLCTYHEANREAGNNICQAIINSVTFKETPINLKERLVESDNYILKVPHGWFSLYGLNQEQIAQLPEKVRNSYNADNPLTLQLLNRNTPDNVALEVINVSYAQEILDLKPESMLALENSVGESFAKNYQEVKKVSSAEITVNGRSGYRTQWALTHSSGLEITSTQEFIACDKGTIINTCIYQANQAERMDATCETVASSIQCK